MDEVKARIGRLIDERMTELKLGNSELARKLETNRQRVHSWRTGNSTPRRAIAPQLARELHLPLSSLSADPSLVNVAELGENSHSTTVPRIDWIDAGKGRPSTDPYPMGEGRDRIDVDSKVSDGTFALDVRGDSMLPMFSEGDTIVVDPAEAPYTGCYVVAELLAPGVEPGDGDKTFKEYKLRGIVEGIEIFDLIPLNYLKHPTITVNQANPGRVIGVVVEYRHRFRR